MTPASHGARTARSLVVAALLLTAGAAAILLRASPTEEDLAAAAVAPSRGDPAAAPAVPAAPSAESPAAKPIAAARFAESRVVGDGVTMVARLVRGGSPVAEADVSVAFFARRAAAPDEAAAAARAPSPAPGGAGSPPPAVASLGVDFAISDAFGRVECAAPFRSGPLDGGRAVFQAFTADGGLVGEASVSLPAWIEPGILDCGDVDFAETAPLLAGEVVDDAGTPVAGATVEIGRKPPKGGRFGVPDFTPYDGLFAFSGRDGKFAVRSTAPPEAWLVRASAPGLLSTTIAAPPGESAPVRLVLTRPARLSIACVFEGRPAPDLRILAVVRRAGVVVAESVSDAGGVVRFAESAPGVVDLELRVCDDDARPQLVRRRAPDLVFAGCELKAGPNDDPRFAPCELSGVLRRYVVHVVDEAGGRIAGAGVALLAAGDEDGGSGRSFAAATFPGLRVQASAALGPGNASVALYARPGEYVLAGTAPGRVPATLRGPGAEETLTLAPSRSYDWAPDPKMIAAFEASAETPEIGRRRLVLESDAPADPRRPNDGPRLRTAARVDSGKLECAGPGPVRWRVSGHGPWREGVVVAEADGRLVLRTPP